MYFTVYKTTNLVNNKVYIGKHQTADLDDEYLGSGVILKEAIKKYGRKSFGKEILFVFDNEHEMNIKEKELVTAEFINRSDTYNIGIGGEGGAHFSGKSHTAYTKKKISDSRKNVVYSEERRSKISEANRRRIVSEETKRKLSEKAKNRTIEVRKSISEKLKTFHKSKE